MSVVEPPAHLSAEAREFLLDPPPVPPGIDMTDLAAVRTSRHEFHAGMLALNDQLKGDWVHRETEIAGVNVVWFANTETALDANNVIVHIHGGSYWLGSPMTNASMVVPIAQRTRLPVVSIDYRLAPEHRCPAAIEDTTAVVAALATDRQIVAMHGESAGGGLALATAVALRDAGEALPLRVGLVSPWVDLTCSGDSYRTLPYVDPDMPDPEEPPAWAAAYAGEATADPNASPLFADLSHLPPTLIQVGGRETVLSDSIRLHRALTAAGTDSSLDVWDGLWHQWHLQHHVPEALTAFDELAVFLTADLAERS